MPEWFDARAWPPARLRDLNPTIDVEDLSMVMARLDDDVYAGYFAAHQEGERGDREVQQRLGN
jgi:hypothetical protein